MKITTNLSAVTGRSFAAVSTRVRNVIARHFDRDGGSPYWLEQERRLGIHAIRDIRCLEDLEILGWMDEAVIRERSVWDFVPRSLEPDRGDFVVVESGGTLGLPKRTVYKRADFRAAFVDPFLAAVEKGFPVPRRASWAYIGPSGPHAIGKAAREVCRAMGSPDPFTVDLDPRWFKAQRTGSLGRNRYLSHVLDQALSIFRHEVIDIVFSTPPLLVELGRRLSPTQRARVATVHLGGLATTADQAAQLTELFPNAVFLAGYGNSLLGMAPQLEPEPLDAPRYYVHGDRLRLRLVPPTAESGTWNGETVSYGERGRILATRLDESFMIVNLRERDTAVRLAPPPEGVAFGFHHDGLGNPQPLAEVPTARLGLY